MRFRGGYTFRSPFGPERRSRFGAVGSLSVHNGWGEAFKETKIWYTIDI